MHMEQEMTDAIIKNPSVPSFTDKTVTMVITDLQTHVGAVLPTRCHARGSMDGHSTPQRRLHGPSSNVILNDNDNDNIELGHDFSGRSRIPRSSCSSPSTLPGGGLSKIAGRPRIPRRASEDALARRPAGQDVLSSPMRAGDHLVSRSRTQEQVRNPSEAAREPWESRSLRVQQAVGGDRPARASEMQLQVYNTERTHRSNSWLWERCVPRRMLTE